MSVPKVYSIMKLSDVGEKPYTLSRAALQDEMKLIERAMEVISANVVKDLAYFSLPSVWQSFHNNVKKALEAKGLPSDLVNCVNCGMVDVADYEFETKPKYKWSFVSNKFLFPEMTKLYLITEAEEKFYYERRCFNELDDYPKKKMLDALDNLEKIYEECGVQDSFNKFVYNYK